MITQNSTKIDGVAYGWNDIQILINGVRILGVMKIDFKDTTLKENLYAATGGQPYLRAYGKTEYDATISLVYNAKLSLYQAVQGAGFIDGSLTNLAPFTVTVILLASKGQGLPRYFELLNVEFMEDSFSLSEGDTKMITEHKLIVGGVNYSKTR